jgi:hypothetical protein
MISIKYTKNNILDLFSRIVLYRPQRFISIKVYQIRMFKYIIGFDIVMVQKGQVGIEYLVLVATALVIVSVVVLLSTGFFGGQKESAQFNMCRQAASLCKNALYINGTAACTECETACKDPATNAPLSPTAIQCCKTGMPDKLYIGFSGTCIRAPDLTVPDISFSKTNPLPGESITITTTINNVGLVGAANFNVLFEYKEAGAATYTKIDSKQVVGVGAEGSITVSTTWGLLALKTYDIRVTADETNVITEADETNNQLVKQISSSYPDLYMQDINIAGGNEAGSTLTITAVVQNIGNVRSPSTDVSFGYKKPTDTQYTMISAVQTVLLQPGGTQTLQTSWTTPAYVGDLDVRAYVDLSYKIKEGNENNNAKTFALLLWDSAPPVLTVRVGCGNVVLQKAVYSPENSLLKFGAPPDTLLVVGTDTSFTISADASDLFGISKMEFYTNDTTDGTFTKEYTCTGKTSCSYTKQAYSTKSYAYYVIAYDPNNNQIKQPFPYGTIQCAAGGSGGSGATCTIGTCVGIYYYCPSGIPVKCPTNTCCSNGACSAAACPK